MDKQKTIGIFGNARGGTSAVAGIVNILGVPFFGYRKSLDDDEMIKLRDLRGLVERRNAEHQIWGFKHPSLLLSANQVGKVLRNPYFIFVSRDPIASTAETSGKFTVDYKLKEAEKRAERFFDALKKCESAPRIVVSYEKLITKPEVIVRQISEFIEMPFKQEAVDFIDVEKGYQDSKKVGEIKR